MRSTRIIYFLTHAILVLLGIVGILAAHWLEAETFIATMAVAVGTSVVAAGVCGMVVWVYLAQTQRSVDLLAALESSGLESIYSSRAAQIRSEYANRLRTARSGIDILGFGLKDFRRDYLNELGDIAKRAPVRILVIDPASPYCRQRDVEEDQSPGIISGEAEEFLRAFRAKYETPPAGLELRTYTSLPEVNIFRIDDEIFWGPYLAGKASGNTMTLRVKRGGFAFDGLQAHFDRVWDDFSTAIN